MDEIYLYCLKSIDNKPSEVGFHMHTHDYYEIYCFFSGNAKYYIEGNIYNLKYAIFCL